MPWLTAGQAADGCNHSTVELKVVVAIEYVVLAVILVMQCDLHSRQPLPELGTCVDTAFLRRVGVATPVHVRLREVSVIFPVLLVDERQDARPIGPRLGPEHAITR